MINFDEYVVVRNSEEQYSVWPTARPLPDGWLATGEQGTRQECLAHIDEIWTDIRPKSVRDGLEAGERSESGSGSTA